MGGRGASSGVSHNGKAYETEYKTVLQSGNIKFVRYNDSVTAKSPMETMIAGRIYVTVDRDNAPKYITMYDENGKRYKQIDVTGKPHMIDGEPVIPHVHYGYEHDEHGSGRTTAEDDALIERVNNIWRSNMA